MSVDIIDDFMPVDYQQHLLAATVYNRDFPWHFLYDMSGASRPTTVDGTAIAAHQHGFQHTIIDHNGSKDSPYEGLFMPLVSQIIEHYKTNIHLVRIKIGMVMPMAGGGVAYPHTDYSSEHKTLVYYVNDTDGDTVFYNEWNDGTPREEFSVERTVHPKMGRAIVFDGLQYHSTSYPTKDVRAFVNINYKIAS
jgi:hypothetical protein